MATSSEIAAEMKAQEDTITLLTKTLSDAAKAKREGEKKLQELKDDLINAMTREAQTARTPPTQKK